MSYIKTHFFTRFILSRASNNTTSQHIGRTNAWAVLPPQTFRGDRPLVPLGLRPACTPPFSRLLRHTGGYCRTILTPNLQGLLGPIFYLIASTTCQHSRSLGYKGVINNARCKRDDVMNEQLGAKRNAAWMLFKCKDSNSRFHGLDS